jgi:glutaredoxin-like protein
MMAEGWNMSRIDRPAWVQALAQLPNPVTLRFFTQTIGCEMCDAARQLLNAVVAASNKVTLEELNVVLDRERALAFGFDRAPALALATDRETGIQFIGAPLGYEVGSLIEAIRMASSGDSGLTDSSRALVATVSQPVHVKVFVTPTCPHCPRAVTLAHRMALENPQITAACIEATEFPDLVRQHRVTGVPKTVAVIGDRELSPVEILGAVPEDEFVRTIVGAATGAA